MPWQEVPKKWKAGKLHSGSKKGPVVKDKDQMVAIMMSEKGSSKAEYHSKSKSKKSKAIEGLKHAK